MTIGAFLFNKQFNMKKRIEILKKWVEQVNPTVLTDKTKR